jgi:transposase
MVVAPALIPKWSGNRIKTNRRDGVTLARLDRAGELTGVWTPDAAHEAVRDLVRAREAAADDVRRNASSCFPSCYGIARFTAEAAIGRWRIDVGSPTGSSNMPRGRLSFRKGSTRSRMLFNVCAASRNSSLSSCRSGRWRRSWKPTRMRGASFLVAMTFAAEIGDVRGSIRQHS